MPAVRLRESFDTKSSVDLNATSTSLILDNSASGTLTKVGISVNVISIEKTPLKNYRSANPTKYQPLT